MGAASALAAALSLSRPSLGLSTRFVAAYLRVRLARPMVRLTRTGGTQTARNGCAKKKKPEGLGGCGSSEVWTRPLRGSSG